MIKLKLAGSLNIKYNNHFNIKLDTVFCLEFLFFIMLLVSIESKIK